jgi:hypothetical protein
VRVRADWPPVHKQREPLPHDVEPGKLMLLGNSLAPVKACVAFEYLPDFSLIFGLGSRLQLQGKPDATHPKTGIPEHREPALSRHRAVCQESLNSLIDPPIKPLFPEAWA